MECLPLADRKPVADPRSDAPALRPLRALAPPAFLRQNAGFRRYVLREIEANGPVLSRDLEDRAKGKRRNHRWYGSRRVGIMLDLLHLRGEIAIVGRRGGQKLWDLADRWYPETER